MLQHLADGRVDLMMGRGNTGPVYPWFGKDIRQGIALAIENYALLHRLWREDVVDWQGKFRTPLQGFTSTPRPLDGVAAVRLARQHPHARDRRAGRLLRRRLLREQHLLAEGALQAPDRAVPPALRALRPRHRRPGDRRPRRSGVHAQELAGRRQRVPPVLRQRAGLRPRPVARGLHRADAAHRRQPAAGHRPHAGVPRLLRRLPAPAVPDGPRRPAAEDRARAARHPRRGGRAGAAQGVRRPAARRTCRTARRTSRSSPARRASAAAARRGPRRRRTPTRPSTCRSVAAREPDRSMANASIAVVSAGLSQPSSTRLLADRLADATVAPPARSTGVDVEVDGRSSCATSRSDVTNNLLTGFPSPTLADVIETVTGGRRPHRRDADLHAPATAGCSSRSST